MVFISGKDILQNGQWPKLIYFVKSWTEISDIT